MARTLRLMLALVLLFSGPALAQGRITAHVSFGLHPATDSFVDETTFPSNRETAHITGTYEVGGGRGIDSGVAVRVWRSLTVGAGIAVINRSSSGAVAASLPHPFLFATDRRATATLDALDRRDLAVHPAIGWQLPSRTNLRVSIFGGPSWYQTRQQVADSVTPAESYPFDTVTLSTSTSELSESLLGFHAGADVSWYLTRTVGFGGIVQYSTAATTVRVGEGAPFDLRAGGFQLAVGIRLRSLR